MARVPASKDTWHLDGQTIVVRIPMRFRRHGGRKRIVAPDGADTWAPAPPRPDNTLVRALGRAHRWKRLLEGGTHASVRELAEAENINASYVSRILRLTLLAPDIVEAILDGRQANTMQLEDFLKPLPIAWDEQRRILATISGLPTD